MSKKSEVPANKQSHLERQFECRIKSLDQRIIQRAEWLRQELERTIAGIKDPDNGPTVNSLGALQGNGVELDRMIGERATLLEIRAQYRAEREFTEVR